MKANIVITNAINSNTISAISLIKVANLAESSLPLYTINKTILNIVPTNTTKPKNRPLDVFVQSNIINKFEKGISTFPTPFKLLRKKNLNTKI
jgi:hypothetical protein